MNNIEVLPKDDPLTPALPKAGDLVTARSAQEVMGMILVAQRFPRSEQVALDKIINACKRRELAEVSTYQFSRGGTKIYGASVQLLRAIAKRWGNIDFGWQEVERKDGESKIIAYAWDVESNSRASMTFSVKHWRDTKDGGHALKDERDIYEATANAAARRVRACLESIIDENIVNLAVEECEKTLKSGQTEPLSDRVAKMLIAFKDKFQVTQPMIEERLQHKADAISEAEMVQLRRIFTSLTDGMAKREDFFKVTVVTKSEPSKPEHSLPSDNPPKAAALKEEPVKAAPVAAPAPVSEPPQPPAEKSDAEKQFDADLQTVAGLIKDAGVTEAQVVAFAKLPTSKLCSKNANVLADFAPPRLKVLIQNWGHIVENVKKQ